MLQKAPEGLNGQAEYAYRIIAANSKTRDVDGHFIFLSLYGIHSVWSRVSDHSYYKESRAKPACADSLQIAFVNG